MVDHEAMDASEGTAGRVGVSSDGGVDNAEVTLDKTTPRRKSLRSVSAEQNGPEARETRVDKTEEKEVPLSPEEKLNRALDDIIQRTCGHSVPAGERSLEVDADSNLEEKAVSVDASGESPCDLKSVKRRQEEGAYETVVGPSSALLVEFQLIL